MNKLKHKYKKILLQIIIPTIVLIIALISTIVYINRYNKEDNNPILIEITKEEDNKMKGIVILSNGEVKEYKKDSNKKITNNYKVRNAVIKESITNNKDSLSKEDLNKLKESLKNIKALYHEYDGDESNITKYINYYNEESKTIISLEQTGSVNLNNESDNINEVLNILNNYKID